jgi:hypothetical protein
MRATRLRKSPDKHFIPGFQKEQTNRISEGSHSLKRPDQISKEDPLTDIDAQRDIRYLTALLIAEFYESWDQRGRKVVNAEIASILKRLQRVRLTGSREATDDDEIQL